MSHSYVVDNPFAIFSRGKNAIRNSIVKKCKSALNVKILSIDQSTRAIRCRVYVAAVCTHGPPPNAITSTCKFSLSFGRALANPLANFRLLGMVCIFYCIYSPTPVLMHSSLFYLLCIFLYKSREFVCYKIFLNSITYSFIETKYCTFVIAEF